VTKNQRLGVVGMLAVFGFAALFSVLPAEGAGVKVKMVRTSAGAFRFRPSVVRVHVGKGITFVNDSGATQDVACAACGFDTGDILPGAIRVVEVVRPGTFPFFSRYYVDSGMRGTVVATGSP
jgi:plastocyanin